MRRGCSRLVKGLPIEHIAIRERGELERDRHEVVIGVPRGLDAVAIHQPVANCAIRPRFHHIDSTMTAFTATRGHPARTCATARQGR